MSSSQYKKPNSHPRRVTPVVTTCQSDNTAAGASKSATMKLNIEIMTTGDPASAAGEAPSVIPPVTTPIATPIATPSPTSMTSTSPVPLEAASGSSVAAVPAATMIMRASSAPAVGGDVSPLTAEIAKRCAAMHPMNQQRIVRGLPNKHLDIALLGPISFRYRLCDIAGDLCDMMEIMKKMCGEWRCESGSGSESEICFKKASTVVKQIQIHVTLPDDDEKKAAIDSYVHRVERNMGEDEVRADFKREYDMFLRPLRSVIRCAEIRSVSKPSTDETDEEDEMLMADMTAVKLCANCVHNLVDFNRARNPSAVWPRSRIELRIDQAQALHAGCYEMLKLFGFAIETSMTEGEVRAVVERAKQVIPRIELGARWPNYDTVSDRVCQAELIARELARQINRQCLQPPAEATLKQSQSAMDLNRRNLRRALTRFMESPNRSEALKQLRKDLTVLSGLRPARFIESTPWSRATMGESQFNALNREMTSRGACSLSMSSLIDAYDALHAARSEWRTAMEEQARDAVEAFIDRLFDVEEEIHDGLTERSSRLISLSSESVQNAMTSLSYSWAKMCSRDLSVSQLIELAAGWSLDGCHFAVEQVERSMAKRKRDCSVAEEAASSAEAAVREMSKQIMEAALSQGKTEKAAKAQVSKTVQDASDKAYRSTLAALEAADRKKRDEGDCDLIAESNAIDVVRGDCFALCLLSLVDYGCVSPLSVMLSAKRVTHSATSYPAELYAGVIRDAFRQPNCRGQTVLLPCCLSGVGMVSACVAGARKVLCVKSGIAVADVCIESTKEELDLLMTNAALRRRLGIAAPVEIRLFDGLQEVVTSGETADLAILDCYPSGLLVYPSRASGASNTWSQMIIQVTAHAHKCLSLGGMMVSLVPDRYELDTLIVMAAMGDHEASGHLSSKGHPFGALVRDAQPMPDLVYSFKDEELAVHRWMKIETAVPDEPAAAPTAAPTSAVPAARLAKRAKPTAAPAAAPTSAVSAAKHTAVPMEVIVDTLPSAVPAAKPTAAPAAAPANTVPRIGSMLRAFSNPLIFGKAEKLAEEAEEKRLAAEAEEKRLAAEAEKRKRAEAIAKKDQKLAAEKDEALKAAVKAAQKTVEKAAELADLADQADAEARKAKAALKAAKTPVEIAQATKELNRAASVAKNARKKADEAEVDATRARRLLTSLHSSSTTATMLSTATKPIPAPTSAPASAKKETTDRPSTPAQAPKPNPPTAKPKPVLNGGRMTKAER